MRKLQALAVGAAGGVLGAALMVPSHSVMAKLLGLPSPTGEDATERVANFFARKFTGRKLRRSRKRIGGQVVHFAFAAGVGALYGLLANRVPAVTAGAGSIFGTAVYVGAHAVTVPAFGLAASPIKNGAAQESAEFVAHLVYGVTTESVRHLLLSR